MTGIVWTGQVNFTDSSDVGVTGVATLTLTPDIGVTNLPALVQGETGPAPTLRNVTVNQVAFGSTPPASTFTQVSPGVYDLTAYMNSGAPGVPGAFALSSATDLTGTLTNKFTLVYSTTDGKWHVSPMLAGDIVAVTPITGFTAYSGSSSQATLATQNIPAQPSDWRPDVDGFATATGTVNTHVNVAVYLNSPTTGDLVGISESKTLASAGFLGLHRSFGAAIGSGSYGRVPAGQAAVLYFVAQQTNSTPDAWGVAAAGCSFSTLVNPIP